MLQKCDCKQIGYRRILVMVFGIIILGLGISLFKLSALGNDPSSAMVMAIGDRIHADFARTLLAANCLWFLAQVIWGRHYIGLGSFVNWFGVGTISVKFTRLLGAMLPEPESFLQKLGVMVVGMLVLSLASSMYQTADLGIAPYDSLSLMLEERLPIPYFWCRIFTDFFCVVICVMFGGLAGIGTLVVRWGWGRLFISLTGMFRRNWLGVRAEGDSHVTTQPRTLHLLQSP